MFLLQSLAAVPCMDEPDSVAAIRVILTGYLKIVHPKPESADNLTVPPANNTAELEAALPQLLELLGTELQRNLMSIPNIWIRYLYNCIIKLQQLQRMRPRSKSCLFLRDIRGVPLECTRRDREDWRGVAPSKTDRRTV